MVALLLVLVAVGCGDACAWDDQDHKVICEIAIRLVKPRTRAEVQNLVSTDERFTCFSDTLQGIYLKLRLLAESESLSGHLEDGPNLLWPRIILTILRDLKALGSLQEPTGEF